MAGTSGIAAFRIGCFILLGWCVDARYQLEKELNSQEFLSEQSASKGIYFVGGFEEGISLSHCQQESTTGCYRVFTCKSSEQACFSLAPCKRALLTFRAVFGLKCEEAEVTMLGRSLAEEVSIFLNSALFDQCKIARENLCRFSSELRTGSNETRHDRIPLAMSSFMDLVDLINCLSNGPLHVGACTITLAGLDSTLVAAVQHPPSTTQYGSDSMFTSRATNNPLSSAVTDQCNFIEDDEMECAQTSKKAYFHTSKQVYRTDAAVDIIASQSSLLPSTSSGSSLQYVPDTTTETGEEDVDEWDCTSTVYTCLGKDILLLSIEDFSRCVVAAHWHSEEGFEKMKTCLNKCQPVTMSSTYGDAKKYYRCMAICAFSTADQGCDVVLDEEESKEIQ
eukprot:gene2211-5222_t